MVQKHFIGTDGGGTKTDMILFNEKGYVHNRIIGPGTNPTAVSTTELKRDYSRMFDQLLRGQYANKIDACFAGIAGASHANTNKVVKKIINENIGEWTRKVNVDHDAVNALWSGTNGEAGVVLIAGTGSIAFGIDSSGKRIRVGGWGHLVGDEGSGYDIGRQAVQAVLRAYDGRGRPTLLTNRVLDHFSLNAVEDLIDTVYQKDVKTKLAALVPDVIFLSNRGDSVAYTIIKDGANQLAKLAVTATSKLKEEGVLVLAGGLWNAGFPIISEVKQRVQCQVVRPKVPPVYGAAIGAMLIEHLSIKHSFSSELAAQLSQKGSEEIIND